MCDVLQLTSKHVINDYGQQSHWTCQAAARGVRIQSQEKIVKFK